MHRAAAVVTAVLVAIVGGCGARPAATPLPSSPTTPAAASSTAPSTPASSTAARSTRPTATRTSTSAKPAPTDPRNVFYTRDKHRYRSAWFDGAWPIMVPYGCTSAPYYSHDARCSGRQGFHHGVDIAMACRTVLRSGVTGTVLSPSAPGAPGAAYGATVFRIRTADGRDVLVAHAVRVFVRPGERVRVGQKIALAGDLGAPDGCHLHLEVRRAGGGLSSALDPSRTLGLRR